MSLKRAELPAAERGLLDGGRAGQPTAPRGQSPTNERLMSAEEHCQQLKQSVDADIDVDATTSILFGSLAGSSSGSSGSDTTSQQSDCLPPPAKLWDESSLRRSDYSQPVADNTDATGLRLATGESIASTSRRLGAHAMARGPGC